MKTEKVQSTQPIFGTRVTMSKKVAELFAASGKSEEILRQIRILEYNSEKDWFSISDHNIDNFIKAQLIEEYKGGNKLHAHSPVYANVKFDNTGVSFDLVKLYTKAKQLLIREEHLSNDVKKFLPYIV